MVSVDGGESTRLAEMRDTFATERLTYDEKRNALFFHTMGKDSDKGFYKWDLSTKTLSRVLEDDGKEPMAADEDYLYWSFEDKIFRLRKF